MGIVLLGQDGHAGDKAEPHPGAGLGAPTHSLHKAPENLSVLFFHTVAITGGQSWRVMSEAAVQLLSLHPAPPAAAGGPHTGQQTARGG